MIDYKELDSDERFLLDDYAGKALQGMLANSSSKMKQEVIIRKSFEIALEMIEERRKYRNEPEE